MKIFQPKHGININPERVNNIQHHEVQYHEVNNALVFDSEKNYQDFLQELNGKPSPSRKRQLTRTKKLIRKYQSLLDDFDYKSF